MQALAGQRKPQLLVTGGRVLSGITQVDGSKNATLPLLAAAALLGERMALLNVPASRDVGEMIALLHSGGYNVIESSDRLAFSPCAAPRSTDMSSAAHIRASYYLVSPLIALSGRSRLPWPGGCAVGHRGMELHFDVYKAFGDQVVTSPEGYIISPGHAVHTSSVEICLPFRSRGATIAAILRGIASHRAVTVHNPNLSVEVTTLVEALAQAGLPVSLDEDSLRLRAGGDSGTFPTEFRIPGDKIEAGTLLTALALTRGRGAVRGVDGAHVDPILRLFTELGFTVESSSAGVCLASPEGQLRPHDLRVVSSLDPGAFDADWEPALLVMGLTLSGSHYCEDRINPGRHGNLVPQLETMGAHFASTSSTECSFVGPQSLEARKVFATDIRTGSALILAGLISSGITIIENPEQIRRGHADLVGKLVALGASVEIADISP